MKNILILGGFGFIGTNIIKHIEYYFNESYNVIIFDKFPHHPHGVTFKSITKVYDGDFSDELVIERIFMENDIDFVIHLLSSTVPTTSTNAKFDAQSNLIPTLSLLNIMDYHKVRDIIYISSGGSIYGEHKKKHREDDPVYPKSSHGIIKFAIERYLLSYSELYIFNSLIIRLSNPFGSYHFNTHQGICNIALRKALNSKKIQIWGDGSGRKDYIYVEDFCKILFKLIENGINTDVINVGSGNLLTVNEILSEIQYFVPNFETEYVNRSIVDITEFELDITKLKMRIGDLKFTGFHDAFLKTYNWAVSIRRSTSFFSCCG